MQCAGNRKLRNSFNNPGYRKGLVFVDGTESYLMRIFGLILIIIGIAMLLFRSISFTKEEKVVDLGPVEVNKKEKKNIGWPTYAGGIAILAGVVLVVADRRKNQSGTV